MYIPESRFRDERLVREILRRAKAKDQTVQPSLRTLLDTYKSVMHSANLDVAKDSTIYPHVLSLGVPIAPVQPFVSRLSSSATRRTNHQPNVRLEEDYPYPPPRQFIAAHDKESVWDDAVRTRSPSHRARPVRSRTPGHPTVDDGSGVRGPSRRTPSPRSTPLSPTGSSQRPPLPAVGLSVNDAVRTLSPPTRPTLSAGRDVTKHRKRQPPSEWNTQRHTAVWESAVRAVTRPLGPESDSAIKVTANRTGIARATQREYVEIEEDGVPESAYSFRTEPGRTPSGEDGVRGISSTDAVTSSMISRSHTAVPETDGVVGYYEDDASWWGTNNSRLGHSSLDAERAHGSGTVRSRRSVTFDLTSAPANGQDSEHRLARRRRIGRSSLEDAGEDRDSLTSMHEDEFSARLGRELLEFGPSTPTREVTGMVLAAEFSRLSLMNKGLEGLKLYRKRRVEMMANLHAALTFWSRRMLQRAFATWHGCIAKGESVISGSLGRLHRISLQDTSSHSADSVLVRRLPTWSTRHVFAAWAEFALRRCDSRMALQQEVPPCYLSAALQWVSVTWQRYPKPYSLHAFERALLALRGRWMRHRSDPAKRQRFFIHPRSPDHQLLLRELPKGMRIPLSRLLEVSTAILRARAWRARRMLVLWQRWAELSAAATSLGKRAALRNALWRWNTYVEESIHLAANNRIASKHYYQHLLRHSLRACALFVELQIYKADRADMTRRHWVSRCSARVLSAWRGWSIHSAERKARAVEAKRIRTFHVWCHVIDTWKQWLEDEIWRREELLLAWRRRTVLCALASWYRWMVRRREKKDSVLRSWRKLQHTRLDNVFRRWMLWTRERLRLYFIVETFQHQQSFRIQSRIVHVWRDYLTYRKEKHAFTSQCIEHLARFRARLGFERWRACAVWRSACERKVEWVRAHALHVVVARVLRVWCVWAAAQRSNRGRVTEARLVARAALTRRTWAAWDTFMRIQKTGKALAFSRRCRSLRRQWSLWRSVHKYHLRVRRAMAAVLRSKIRRCVRGWAVWKNIHKQKRLRSERARAAVCARRKRKYFLVFRREFFLSRLLQYMRSATHVASLSWCWQGWCCYITARRWLAQRAASVSSVCRMFSALRAWRVWRSRFYQTRFLSIVADRRLCDRLREAWTRWTSLVQQAKHTRAARAGVHSVVRLRLVRVVWHRWRVLFGQCVRARVVVDWLAGGRCCRVFHAWRDVAQTRKAFRSRLELFSERLWRVSLTRALRCLNKNASTQARLREAASNVTRYRTERMQHSVIHCLAVHSQRAKANKATASLMFSRHVRAGQRAVWNEWASYAAFAKHSRVLYIRAIRHWYRRLSRRVFILWRVWWGRQALCKEAHRRIRHSRLRRIRRASFAVWCAAAVQSHRARFASELSARFRRMRLLRFSILIWHRRTYRIKQLMRILVRREDALLHLGFRGLQRATTAGKRLREHIGAARDWYAVNLKFRTFTCWVAYRGLLRSRQALFRVVSRVCAAVLLRDVLGQWSTAVRWQLFQRYATAEADLHRRRSLLFSCFSRLARGVYTRRRARQQASAAWMWYKQHLVFRMFRAWRALLRDLNEEKKFEILITGHAARAYQRLFLRSWRKHVMECRMLSVLCYQADYFYDRVLLKKSWKGLLWRSKENLQKELCRRRADSWRLLYVRRVVLVTWMTTTRRRLRARAAAIEIQTRVRTSQTAFAWRVWCEKVSSLSRERRLLIRAELFLYRSQSRKAFSLLCRAVENLRWLKAAALTIAARSRFLVLKSNLCRWHSKWATATDLSRLVTQFRARHVRTLAYYCLMTWHTWTSRRCAATAFRIKTLTRVHVLMKKAVFFSLFRHGQWAKRLRLRCESVRELHLAHVKQRTWHQWEVAFRESRLRKIHARGVRKRVLSSLAVHVVTRQRYHRIAIAIQSRVSTHLRIRMLRMWHVRTLECRLRNEHAGVAERFRRRMLYRFGLSAFSLYMLVCLRKAHNMSSLRDFRRKVLTRRAVVAWRSFLLLKAHALTIAAHMRRRVEYRVRFDVLQAWIKAVKRKKHISALGRTADRLYPWNLQRRTFASWLARVCLRQWKAEALVNLRLRVAHLRRRQALRLWLFAYNVNVVSKSFRAGLVKAAFSTWSEAYTLQTAEARLARATVHRTLRRALCCLHTRSAYKTSLRAAKAAVEVQRNRCLCERALGMLALACSRSVGLRALRSRATKESLRNHFFHWRTVSRAYAFLHEVQQTITWNHAVRLALRALQTLAAVADLGARRRIVVEARTSRDKRNVWNLWAKRARERQASREAEQELVGQVSTALSCYCVSPPARRSRRYFWGSGGFSPPRNSNMRVSSPHRACFTPQVCVWLFACPVLVRALWWWRYCVRERINMQSCVRRWALYAQRRRERALRQREAMLRWWRVRSGANLARLKRLPAFDTLFTPRLEVSESLSDSGSGSFFEDACHSPAGTVDLRVLPGKGVLPDTPSAVLNHALCGIDWALLSSAVLACASLRGWKRIVRWLRKARAEAAVIRCEIDHRLLVEVWAHWCCEVKARLRVRGRIVAHRTETLLCKGVRGWWRWVQRVNYQRQADARASRFSRRVSLTRGWTAWTACVHHMQNERTLMRRSARFHLWSVFASCIVAWKQFVVLNVRKRQNAVAASSFLRGRRLRWAFPRWQRRLAERTLASARWACACDHHSRRTCASAFRAWLTYFRNQSQDFNTRIRLFRMLVAFRAWRSLLKKAKQLFAKVDAFIGRSLCGRCRGLLRFWLTWAQWHRTLRRRLKERGPRLGRLRLLYYFRLWRTVLPYSPMSTPTPTSETPSPSSELTSGAENGTGLVVGHSQWRTSCHRHSHAPHLYRHHLPFHHSHGRSRHMVEYEHPSSNTEALRSERNFIASQGSSSEADSYSYVESGYTRSSLSTLRDSVPNLGVVSSSPLADEGNLLSSKSPARSLRPERVRKDPMTTSAAWHPPSAQVIDGKNIPDIGVPQVPATHLRSTGTPPLPRPRHPAEASVANPGSRSSTPPSWTSPGGTTSRKSVPASSVPQPTLPGLRHPSPQHVHGRPRDGSPQTGRHVTGNAQVTSDTSSVVSTDLAPAFLRSSTSLTSTNRAAGNGSNIMLGSSASEPGSAVDPLPFRRRRSPSSSLQTSPRDSFPAAPSLGGIERPPSGPQVGTTTETLNGEFERSRLISDSHGMDFVPDLPDLPDLPPTVHPSSMTGGSNEAPQSLQPPWWERDSPEFDIRGGDSIRDTW